MVRLDERSADCLVLTYKEGLLSAVAHDLKIRVSRFQIEVDEVARRIEGQFDATSLRVVCAMHAGVDAEGALSMEQKREIEGNIVRHVLAAERFPKIRYVSSSVVNEGDVFRVAGELSLHGERRQVDVSVRKERDRYVAAAEIHQPDFGIRPYSALLGTLKVKSHVAVQVAVPWPD
jgi:YceI-like domain